MSDIFVRELDESDPYDAYCKLLSQLTSINIENITQESFAKRVKLIKSNPLHKIFVAISSGKIVGTASVIIEPKFIHDLSFVSHIEDVVVDLDAREGGIGKKLMEHSISFSKEANCYKIILDCSDDNVGFYKKMGFKVKEKQMALYIE